LRVVTLPGDLGGQVWYAKDLGYFEAAGLDVTVEQLGSSAIPPAVASGAIDIALYAVPAIALARTRGIPFTIIAAGNMYVDSAPTAGLLAVLKTSPVRTAKDLSGKTVAVFGLQNLPHLGARAWIDRNGGDSSTVKFVQMTLPDMAAALLAGQVDAAEMDAASDPNLGKPADSFRLLGTAFGAVAPVFMAGAWFTSESWLDAHRPAAKQFAAVMRRSAVWGNSHTRESAPIVEKYNHLPPGQLDNATRVTYGTELNARFIQPELDLGIRYGSLPAGITTQALVTTL
jgi:NitT/TauT family transport system substrate-binding protein